MAGNSTNSMASGVTSGRLDGKSYAENFSDLHPPLDANRAKIEADRCYFCFDAPCMQACPTSIDVSLFIRQIAAGNGDGAGQTIFNSNILGGMCARVCPTETLCEEACVHMAQGNRPVEIGLLQRFATDLAMQNNSAVFSRAEPSGKKVAVVGAGPAGLACAHALAIRGHDITIFEARNKPGGLNEYGLAAYKTTGDFAQREIEFVLSVGGISINYGQQLGKDITVSQLSKDFDAVFLGLGLGATSGLGIDGDDLDGVIDAVDYIADLRQASDPGTLPVGQNVVVIGGGMTAIDMAVQIKKLGADNVTLAYRRGPEQMGASEFERKLAQTSGVNIRFWAMPTRINGLGGKVANIDFERSTLTDDGKLIGTGDFFTLASDQVFRAIGQNFEPAAIAGENLELNRGRIAVDENGKTSMEKVWAGGDCIAGGEDLTVSSVRDGNTAATSIDAFLRG